MLPFETLSDIRKECPEKLKGRINEGGSCSTAEKARQKWSPDARIMEARILDWLRNERTELEIRQNFLIIPFKKGGLKPLFFGQDGEEGC